MAAPNRLVLMATAFVVPVICCLICAGAFVHLATSSTRKQQDEDASLVTRLAEQRDASFNLKDRLKQMKNRIAALNQELKKADIDKKLERNHRKEVRILISTAAKLQDEQSSIRKKVARAGAVAGKMDSLRTEIALLKSSKNELFTRLRLAESEHGRLLALHDTALKKRKEKKKVFLVTALNGGGTQHAGPAIFAECGADGVTIQPAKRLLKKDMGIADQRAFLSVVRKTRYVVFLIRPDGFESFRRYRSLVASKNRLLSNPIDIGFEPVNGDWVLTYPKQGGQSYAKFDER